MADDVSAADQLGAFLLVVPRVPSEATLTHGPLADRGARCDRDVLHRIPVGRGERDRRHVGVREAAVGAVDGQVERHIVARLRGETDAVRALAERVTVVVDGRIDVGGGHLHARHVVVGHVHVHTQALAVGAILAVESVVAHVLATWEFPRARVLALVCAGEVEIDVILVPQALVNRVVDPQNSDRLRRVVVRVGEVDPRRVHRGAAERGEVHVHSAEWLSLGWW